MPVVINYFEVVPSPVDEIKAPAKEAKGKGAETPMTDHEVKKMLERRVERLERVSAS
jgi:hypothetical protein